MLFLKSQLPWAAGLVSVLCFSVVPHCTWIVAHSSKALSWDVNRTLFINIVPEIKIGGWFSLMILCFSTLKEIACNDTCKSGYFQCHLSMNYWTRVESWVTDFSLLENVLSIALFFFLFLSVIFLIEMHYKIFFLNCHPVWLD